MTLKEILQLPKDVNSLQLIKTYLNQPLDYHDQIAAFSHYCGILFELYSYEVLLNEIHSFFQRFLTSEYHEIVDKIMTIYIDAAFELHRYPEAKKMIDERKSRLPLLKQYLLFNQERQYLETMNQLQSDWIQSQLQDHIPTSIQLVIKDALIQAFIKEKKFEEALTFMHTLTKEEQTHVQKSFVICFDALEQFSEVVLLYKDVQQLKLTPFDVYYLVKAYIALGEDQKVINLEVDYESLMDQPNDYKMDYFTMLLHFYERIQNALSVKIYQQKIKAIKTQEKQVNKELDKDQTKQNVNIELIQQPKTLTIETIERIHLVVQEIFKMHDKLSMRDDLRLKSILLNRICDFDTYLIYRPSIRTLYFYKKERFYDKKIKPEQLEGTFLKKILQNDKDGFIERLHFEGFQDILTQKNYIDLTHMYVYRYDDMIIMFYYQKDIKHYGEDDDVLRLISQYLGYALTSQDHYDHLLKHHMMFESFIKHTSLPFRYFFQGYLRHSTSAKKLLQVEEEETLESFVEKLTKEDKVQYQTMMHRLLNLEVQQADITYVIENKRIKETMQVSHIDQHVVIMSTFEDMQHQIEIIENVEKDAMRDPLTGLMNFTAFKRDIGSLMKHKVTFLLIDIQTQLIYLYGLKKYHTYFNDFCQETIQYFSDEQLYVYNDHQLIVVLPGNDIRTVEKHLEHYQNNMNNVYSKIISTETYPTHIGILRYPVSTKQQDFESIMHYLHIALFQAKRTLTRRHDFAYSDYEADMKEQYLLDQMHEAINHDLFDIGFHQIIDQSSNKMWMYESFIYLKNIQIAHQDLVLVAKKRHRLFDLDMAHIKVVFDMLTSLFKETGSYIKIVVPIDAETLKHPKFNLFMTRYMMQYKIPKNIIHINVIGDLKASTYVHLFHDLIGLGIGIQTSSLKIALYYPVTALHFDVKYPDDKMMSYLTSIKQMMQQYQVDFVIRNVLNKDIKQLLDKEHLHIIEGPIYKKLTKQQVFDKVKYKITN